MRRELGSGDYNEHKDGVYMQGEMLRNGFAIAIMAAALAGCGSSSLFEKKGIDYKSASTLPPLEVPPDLTAPTADDRFAVPDVSPRGTATFSSYSRDREGRPAAGSTNVLPDQAKAHIERAGTQRWLVVNAPPEEVWPLVKNFWQEIGFVIAVERPEAGVMETDWAENRAKLPQDPIRNVLGKILDNFYSTGERDKFRTRLERGAQQGTTEIYVSHRAMHEVVTGTSSSTPTTVWEPQPANPDLEAEMLRRLMVRFGVEEARAKDMVASGAVERRAELKKAPDGSARLVINEPFDRAWRRVGLALDRVGFTVEDRDRSKGVYYVRYVDPDADTSKKDKGFLSKLAFWKSNADEAKAAQYQIRVAEQNGTSEVIAIDPAEKKNGSPTSGRILNLLYEQLK